MQFKLWLETEDLRYLLSPPGQTGQIGSEQTFGDDSEDGIVKYVSPQGSYRYVYLINKKPVSALQVVSSDGVNGIIANVFTKPDFRRHGFAKKLFQMAQQDFTSVQHSKHVGDMGAAWIKGLPPSG